MGRKSLFLSALVVLATLAGCDGRVAGQGAPWVESSDRVVFRVSPDGAWLEGLGVGRGVTPLGRIRLPENAVWSVAGAGPDLRVWVHSDTRVMLVDARRWAVVGDWPRGDASGDAPALIARRATDVP